MKILYIDTTSNYLYSALFIDDKITGEIKEKLGKDLSVFTLDKIKTMLDNNSLLPSEVDSILVVNGPGSFTGIRIGVTIAKILAHTLNKEIRTTSSLEAMAISSTKQTDYIVPVIDARRGYIYTGIYDKSYNQILKNQYISLENLKKEINKLPGTYSIISNDDLDFEVIEKYEPNFLDIININKEKATTNPHSVNPIYLKLTEAEEKQEEVDVI